MTDKEAALAFIYTESLKKSDAIILLEGDGFFRVPYAAELYEQGWGEYVVISGGVDEPKKGAFPAMLLKKKLMRGNVPGKHIILEEVSTNTREQAEQTLLLAKKHHWERIILVASHYHQPRAFLTFLKVLKERQQRIELINAPVRGLPWFAKNPWGKRIDLLKQELQKIDRYRKRGHVATWKEALQYHL